MLDPEEESKKLVRNVVNSSSVEAASCPKRPEFLSTQLSKPTQPRVQ